jgi:predicted peptidase
MLEFLYTCMMYKSKSGISALITLVALTSTIGLANPDENQTQPTATAVAEASVEYIHKTVEVDDQEYIWTIMIPPSAKKGGAGLLFLHGKGQCGSDGELHIKYGLPPAIEKNPGAWPFVVFIPQKKSGADWNYHTEAIMQLLDESIEEGYADPNRIGITGLSQGGQGSMVFASEYPDRFSAVAPVCGYAHVAHDENGDDTPLPSIQEYQALMLKQAQSLKDTPVWLFHGDEDRAVPVDCSRVMNHALKSMGADVTYTEFKGVDHDAWDPAYAMTELGNWFAKHLAE